MFGSNALKDGQEFCKVIHVLEGFNQAEHPKVLNVRGLQSTTDIAIINRRSRDSTDRLGMKHGVAKFIPRLLSQEQKEFRTEVAEHRITQVSQSPLPTVQTKVLIEIPKEDFADCSANGLNTGWILFGQKQSYLLHFL